MGNHSDAVISASTLVMLLELPPSKATKHLKLLTMDDACTFKEHIGTKIDSAEAVIQTISEREDTEAKFMADSAKQELLTLYGILAKTNDYILKLEKEERKEESRKAQAADAHQRALIAQANKHLIKG